MTARGAGACGRGVARRTQAQLRAAWRGPRMGHEDAAGGGPQRRAQDPPSASSSASPELGVDGHEVEAVAAASRRRDASRRGASRGRSGPRARRELALVASVGSDEVDLVEAGALGCRQARAVGRPGGLDVVHARRAGERSHGAALQRGHADLAAVEVGARGERVGDLAAVGRHDRLALVAVALEVAVGGREPPRPGVGTSTTASRVASSRSTEITRRSSSIQTGLEPSISLRGGPPARARATRGPRRRRPPWRRRATAAAASSQKAPGRGRWSAPGGAPAFEVEQPDVRRVGVLDEDGAAAVGAHRSASAARRVATASRRQCGGGLRSLRGWATTPRCSSRPIQIELSSGTHPLLESLQASRARAARSSPGRSRPPGRPRSAGRVPPSARPAAR